MKNYSAFPISKEIAESNPESQGGLSKRELFAAIIMGHVFQAAGISYHEKAAENAQIAVKHADALLKELEATK